MVGTGRQLVNFSSLYKQTLNDKNAVKELIDFFLENVGIFLNSSEEAVRFEKSDVLLSIARKIRNGARHIYSEKIIDIASDIEICCYKNDFERATVDINALKIAIKDLKDLEDSL